ncbi:MAG TPA: thioredoxin [Methanomassiliicoccaceae archaeon]|jgi:thioredoxin 1|nr:thioredoxin [Methanomassiliicoccaceae archaeon]HQD87976.1 thioredoxin [Methanomassiliicoccaceae archaeon]
MDELERIREKKMQEMAARNDWPSEPVNVNDDNINDFIRRYGLALVDCWAPWCGPCRMMSPVIDALAKDLQGKVAFAKLNTDENQRTAMRYTIEAIPTLLVFKDGELVDRWVGARPKEDLARRLQAML